MMTPTTLILPDELKARIRRFVVLVHSSPEIIDE